MTEHKFHRLDLLIWLVVKALYLYSLTALIPFGALFFTSGFRAIPQEIQHVPLISFGLFVASLIILFAHYRDIAHALASLGWMGLLCGITAVLFHLFHPQSVLGLFKNIVYGFDKIEPVILKELNDVLPTIWLFIVSYMVFGIVLLYVAGKIEPEHSMMSTVRNIFRPRDRRQR